MECKLLVGEFESERHPDLAVYKTKPPRKDDFWFSWVPEIVVEVVSPGSESRDYIEKREEYFAMGVKEYWIVDAEQHRIVILRRARGKWIERILGAQDSYQCKLLPGFILDCDQVLAAE
jgi:Uma2 family endonuclease